MLAERPLAFHTGQQPRFSRDVFDVAFSQLNQLSAIDHKAGPSRGTMTFRFYPVQEDTEFVFEDVRNVTIQKRTRLYNLPLLLGFLPLHNLRQSTFNVTSLQLIKKSRKFQDRHHGTRPKCTQSTIQKPR